MARDPLHERMAPRRLAFAGAGILALLAVMFWRAPQFEPDHARTLVTLSGPTMGTTFTVKVVTGPVTVPDEDLKQAVQTALDRVDVLMSTYRDDSEISRFNADTSLAPMKLSAETAEVIACALKVGDQSAGAYDITVGPIVNAYGFGPDGEQSPPTDAQLEELRRHVGLDKLEFDPASPTLRKTDPAVKIDLNSIAPGFAVDLIARGLAGLGVEEYLIEIGGEVRAQGLNDREQAWRIGIEKPVETRSNPHLVIPLNGLALATSGDYRAYREMNGLRISHTIDARTGRPVQHNLASVSVLHPECMWADAYATALLALGAEDGRIMAEILKLPALFITRQADGTFANSASPAYEAKFGPQRPLAQEQP